MLIKRPVAVAAVVFAAACGGGSDDFVEKASDVCLDYQQHIEVGNRPLELAGYPAYLDDVLPAARRTRAEVGELEPPDEIARDVQRMLRSWDAILEIASDLRRQAAAERFEAALAALELMNDADAEAVDAAHDAGIPACADFAPFTSRD